MPKILIDLGGADNTVTYGNDDYSVIGQDGNNTLTFGNGDDDLTLGNGNNTLTLGGGTDSIVAGTGNNTITVKGLGVSRITLDGGNNTVTVGDGPTVILAGDGLNTITTGFGDNRVTVGDGINVITTGDGDSLVTVGDGNGNTISVGTGANRIVLGQGTENNVSAAAGHNLVYVSAASLGTDSIRGGLDNGDGDGNTLVLTSFGLLDPLGVSGFEIFRLAQGGPNVIALTNANFARLPGGIITVLGGDGGNTVDGSALAAANALTVKAGLGIDHLTGGAGLDTLSYAGSAGAVAVDLATRIVSGGDAAGDVILGFEHAIGGGGDDRLVGSAVANILRGGAGADSLLGGAGNDLLSGGTGDDTMDGGIGRDRMDGGTGNDLYLVENVGDRAFETLAGGGIDTVRASVSFTLGAGLETLILEGTAEKGVGNALANRIVGNNGANFLLGGDGGDTLIGGDGNDTLIGGTGSDSMDGGEGDDLYVVDAVGDSTEEAMADGGADRVLASVSFTLGANLETLILTDAAIAGTGNALANRILGNGEANVLRGEGGIDVLLGNAGSDSLHGGLGADRLSGGAGADAFFFDTALGAGNVDVITDFQAGQDSLMLSAAVFGGLPVGALAAGAFALGAAAGQADDRILYNAANGALAFDQDGVGGAAAIRFAMIGAGLDLHASDLSVFG